MITIKVNSKELKHKKGPAIRYKLPRFAYEPALLALAETIDWGIKIIGVPNFWSQTKGEGIRVAVLDTGIDYAHPDLKDAIEDMKDFSGSRSGPNDTNGHGTHVSGTIAARENSSGVIGAAPLAKILTGKVLGDDGSGSDQSVAAGIRWAIQKKVDIISMSLGAPQYSRLIHSAIKEAHKKGIFIITAAGNEGPSLDTVGYPARLPECLAVGAIDRNLKVTRFSSRGDTVDIVAPGDQILSTYPPKRHARLSGTSMATPLVSGVVALMLAKHKKVGGGTPIKNNKDLIEHLHKTAIDAGPQGFDPQYGYGIINPKSLLNIAEKPDGPVNGGTRLGLTLSDLSTQGRKKVKSFLGNNDEVFALASQGRVITIQI